MSGVTGGKGAPAPPDFTAAAEAQSKSGRVDSPFASWNGNGTQFTGGLQQGAENLMNQVGSQGALPSGMEARDQAITSAYNQAASRLDPRFSQMETGLRSRLANQGLDPGSEAADNAMAGFGRERNDAYSSAMANAIGQGTSAGNAIFQQGVQSQNQPYQQLGSLASLLGANRGNETQYLNAANAGYQGALNQYGTEQAGKNSLFSGLTNLGGMAAMGAMMPAAAPAVAASDERLKVKVERSMLEAIPGVPFASWEWAHEPGTRHFGVIAQDLEKVAPQYVHETAGGVKFVDYSFLGAANV